MDPVTVIVACVTSIIITLILTLGVIVVLAVRAADASGEAPDEHVAEGRPKL